MKNAGTVTVLWHLKRFPASLGRGALLLAEAQAHAGRDMLIDIAVIEQGQSLPPMLADLMRNVRGVRTITAYPSLRDVPSSNNMWPSSDEEALINYDADTTLRLQQKFMRDGYRPRLRINSETTRTARDLLGKTAGGKPAIAVHLKNQTGGESNANAEIWGAFMQGRPEVMFILIGHDTVPCYIAGLANVVTLSSLAPSLDIHMAMLSEAKGFLGMQSGPANFAILSDTPYAIFKNPGHHAAEMIREIGDKDYYVFATPQQKIWREFETVVRLNAAAAMILTATPAKEGIRHAS